MPRDYYETLGVSKTANEDEIKRAYRNLARQYHPDRNPGDKQAEQRFKEVQEAYDVLSDKTKRANFDRFGFAGPNGGAGGGPGGATFHWGGGAPGGFSGEIDPEEIFQFFSDLGGAGGGARPRGRRSRQARPREEVESEIEVPFETAAVGGKISIRIDSKELDISIPAGTNDGSKLRLRGQGPGGEDVVLKIKVRPHRFFKREGDNVILETPISIAEAVLGGAVDVPTLDGSRLSVKVPPGTSSGARLRLRGKGIKGGDQYLEMKVVVPGSVDERSKELIQEFANHNPQNPRADIGW
jgi:DnaJ-class molecular chaperone